MNNKPTVFIIDDDQAVLESLTLLLEQKDFAVEAFDSAEAFLAAFRPAPNSCAIVDLRMPGMDGMQLQEELSRRRSLVPIIFLTGHGDIPLSVRAIKAGAVDFLTKPVTAAVLIKKVAAALLESKRLFSRQNECSVAGQLALSMTKREREVWTLIAEGLHNKEIARCLGISHRTVETHRMRVMKKTGAENLIDLVRIYNLSQS
jgi:FixJ family two-component response regulator